MLPQARGHAPQAAPGSKSCGSTLTIIDQCGSAFLAIMVVELRACTAPLATSGLA
jgi:hypothetical protein